MRENLVSGTEGLKGLLQSITEKILIDFKNKYGEICIIGIRKRGDIIAKRIVETIKEKTSYVIDLGVIDITLYRDDLTTIGPVPVIGTTELPFSIENKIVILVDDVLYTGRTVRAAIDELIDFGRPKRIYLCVLVDRDGRELPICPDYVGTRIETEKKENVSVLLKEIDGKEGIYIISVE